MARLSEDEQKALKALQAKAEAPDEPRAARSINVSLDLGDDEQIKKGIKLGLLDNIFGEEKPDGEDEEDEAPKRRGYFS